MSPAEFQQITHATHLWFDAWSKSGADTEDALGAIRAWDERDPLDVQEHRTASLVALATAALLQRTKHPGELLIDARMEEVPEDLHDAIATAFPRALSAVTFASAQDGAALAPLIFVSDPDERLALRYALLRVAQGALAH